MIWDDNISILNSFNTLSGFHFSSLQEDSEIWEPKLPRDYNEIIRLSETPEMHTKKKKDIYKKLSNGIFLQKEKVWLLHDNGKTNKMISATRFSYENRESHKWKSVQKSRFRTVAKMLDISNLKIKITMDTQFLSPGVIYGAHLVFKFCDPRKFSSKPLYVNLKYRNRNTTLHSYFATWRDDGWMMIELCRFLHPKEDIDLEVLLESFSRYYCRSGAIYIQGIEFQAISNVAHDDIKNQNEVENSNSNMPANSEEIIKRSEHDELSFWLREVYGKKRLTLSAKELGLYNSPPIRWKVSLL
ncbi:hypothetical protein L1987_03234 [Smallanthus sonchifolius]|uniref:Uncharacterized protein n=1 Tax=Smallanthus sonchifolius TaxID=185202 RepID=A0ACB9KA80_9ASTR|nr:hypothetical protein L1987_03234 [Smallanthus sonchifolius]